MRNQRLTRVWLQGRPIGSLPPVKPTDGFETVETVGDFELMAPPGVPVIQAGDAAPPGGPR